MRPIVRSEIGVLDIRENKVSTEAGQKNATAYDAQYRQKDLHKAFLLYKNIIAAHPGTKEAGYSRYQVQSIVNAVVPKKKSWIRYWDWWLFILTKMCHWMPNRLQYGPAGLDNGSLITKSNSLPGRIRATPASPVARWGRYGSLARSRTANRYSMNTAALYSRRFRSCASSTVIEMCWSTSPTAIGSSRAARKTASARCRSCPGRPLSLR